MKRNKLLKSQILISTCLFAASCLFAAATATAQTSVEKGRSFASAQEAANALIEAAEKYAAGDSRNWSRRLAFCCANRKGWLNLVVRCSGRASRTSLQTDRQQ